MADKSSIEWCDATWNPIVGCTIVSPGCTNCYAMGMAARIEKMASSPMAANVNVQTHYAGTTQQSKAGAVWTGKVAQAPEHILLQPLKWKRPRKIFVNSMGDLFHESIPDEWIDRVFAVMALCPQHTFQVLTKRAERMRAYMTTPYRHDVIGDYMIEIGDVQPGFKCVHWPFPNVWLGISCERQEEADERISHLLQTPAAVRFISAEPLLGPIDLRKYLYGKEDHGVDMTREVGSRVGCCVGWTPPLDWVIAGGESGAGAREHDLEWSRSIIKQCKAASVAVFEKQIGSAPFSAKDRITYRGCKRSDRPSGFSRFLNNRKGGDWSEWPEDLRVREFPVTDVSVTQSGVASHEENSGEATRA